jgi:uncharacterized membrane protein YgcG
MPPISVTPADTPCETVTVVRYLPQLRDLRDPGLLFAVQVPREWNVSTWRLSRADLPEYRTDLVAGGVFAIHSYPSSRSREQEFRDQFRRWSPAPAESVVTLSGTAYDRFESTSGGNTTVAYLMDTNGANERGYASVLVFMARDGNRFEREDFEKAVASFRYYSRSSAATIPGEEIPLYDLAGTTIPRKDNPADLRIIDSSDWDTSDSGYSGGETTGQESAGGSSSGGGTSGGGCHR